MHGSAVLMGLNGPDTVDFTEAQWEIVTGISRRVAAKPEA